VEKIISSTEFYIPAKSKLHGILNDTVSRMHFIEEPIAVVEGFFDQFYEGVNFFYFVQISSFPLSFKYEFLQMDLSPQNNFDNVLQTLTVNARNGIRNFLKIPPFDKWSVFIYISTRSLAHKLDIFVNLY